MNTRIKKLRKLLGLTQIEFAKKVGVNYSRISIWETSEGGISTTNIKRICSVFGVNPEWLVEGKGETFAAQISLHKGDRLKAAREKVGYTQAEFAKLAGLYPDTVSKWEKSGKFPEEYDSTFSDILRVNQEWLRDGKGEMERDDSDVVLKRLYDSATELGKEEKRAILLTLRFVARCVMQSERSETRNKAIEEGSRGNVVVAHTVGDVHQRVETKN